MKMVDIARSQKNPDSQPKHDKEEWESGKWYLEYIKI